MTQFNKDPMAVKDYGFDWGLWMSSGDTISSSVFSAGGSCAITSSSVSSYQTVTFVGSGVPGETNKITNRIVTSQGRTEEKSFDLRIINL